MLKMVKRHSFFRSLHNFKANSSTLNHFNWLQSTTIMNRLEPLYYSMVLVGLDPSPVPPNHLKTGGCIWRQFFIAIITISLLHNVALFVYLIHIDASNSAFFMLFCCIKLFLSLIVAVTFWRKRQSVATIIQIIDHELFLQLPCPLSTDYNKIIASLKRKFLIYVVISWTSIGILIGTNICSTLTNLNLSVYIHYYWFGIGIEHLGTILARALSFLEPTVYYLATAAPVQFVSLYYILLCQLMTILFELFNQQTVEQAKSGVISIKTIRQIHQNLSQTCRRIDQDMSLLALLQFLIIMFELSKYVYYLIERFTLHWITNRLETVFVLIRVVHLLWLFSMLSFSADQLTEQSVACVDDLEMIASSLDRNTQFGGGFDEQQHHLMGLLLKLSRNPVQMTGWKLFPINRSFTLTLLGVVMTYSLILFQMTPWITKYDCKSVKNNSLT